jgi:ubiquitin C-terminal hydrolase
MWKVDQSKDTVEDISEQIYATNGNPDQLPIEVHGQLLDRAATIEAINVADNEVLMLEVKISTDQRDQTPFACAPAGRGAGLDNQASSKNKKFQQMNRNKQQIEEEERKRMSLELIDVMRQHHNGGLTGLQNLGNTCFMSSVLQCLANTEPLTKYFLFEVYSFHLNSKSSLGTRGKLALAFGELVGELFVGQNRYVAPWDVKRIVAMKASQFQGFAQHDSQEMLSVLLETLHEDVNAISKKPYVEYKDSDNRSDAEVSKEYWEGFRKRESSIFIDLFYGQLKSRVQCTQCDRVSITFDPFNVLSLPIPSQKN